MRTGSHVLGAFNIDFDSFVDNIVFCALIDRVGKYQLAMQKVSAYAPMAESMPQMLREEAFHLATGVVPLRRWAEAAARGEVYRWTAIQKHLNKWVPRGLEMFGDERGGGTNVKLRPEADEERRGAGAVLPRGREGRARSQSRYLRARLPELDAAGAEAALAKLAEEGAVHEGVRPEDLLRAPHVEYFRRRGEPAFRTTGWGGESYADVEEYLRHLVRTLPDGYRATRDFQDYVEALRAVAPEPPEPERRRDPRPRAMSLFDWLIVRGLPLVPKRIVGRVASRYVAGETLEDALGEIARLAADGAMATLDLLGEEVRDRERALSNVAEYERMLDAIAARGLPSNISIKPTALGLAIDEGFCRDNVAHLAETARRQGNFVRIDMEDISTTDATLRIYGDLQPRLGNLGVVFQAYLRRTLGDIDRLPRERANVRLCKGIYLETREHAYPDFDTVRLNFLLALEKLLARGVYTAIATHDEHLVAGALGLVDRLRVPRERYEFQMLLGVEPELRRILLAAGHRLRVYIPYGKDWYPYSIRRLRENPRVARHVIRALVARGR
jgi:proline dehydrogenase